MPSWIRSILAALLATACVVESASSNGSCTAINKRKSWNALTDSEKQAFIDAELCIMSQAPKVGIPGAKNLWDELHYTHIYQGNYIHYVGHFLPWHRYFVRAHELLLQQECNYTGAHPYWDELTDYESAPLNQSSIFDPNTGFGGNGVSNKSWCIADGPFKDLRLHMRIDSNYEDYCLYREFDVDSFAMANSSNIAECFAKENYTDAWSCYNGYPHGAGHGAVGGLMLDPTESNGDPTFFLHHAYLDRLWWRWQQADLPKRLTDMGGQNMPDQSVLDMAGLSAAGSELTDYNGDPGNVTTLNHVLFIQNLVPNVTISDIMDLGGDTICAEYVD